MGPKPETFTELLSLPVQTAWSLHSVNDNVRKLLVPSTKYTTIEMRDSIIMNMMKKPYKKRVLLVAFTLISGINDSLQDAKDIYEFLLPLHSICSKVIINLIPYNNIYTTSSSSGSDSINKKRMNSLTASFERPADNRILAMMQYLREKGLFYKNTIKCNIQCLYLLTQQFSIYSI